MTEPVSEKSVGGGSEEPPADITALVAKAKSNWCAFSHGHGMLPDQIAAIDELARLADSREAAAEDTSKWQMSAYYYTFDRTGDARIDRILSAVAAAGKSFHNTEDWNEKAGAWPNLRGEIPVEWIQNAANDAAIRALPLAPSTAQETR